MLSNFKILASNLCLTKNSKIINPVRKTNNFALDYYDNSQRKVKQSWKVCLRRLFANKRNFHFYSENLWENKGGDMLSLCLFFQQKTCWPCLYCKCYAYKKKHVFWKNKRHGIELFMEQQRAEATNCRPLTYTEQASLKNHMDLTFKILHCLTLSSHLWTFSIYF